MQVHWPMRSRVFHATCREVNYESASRQAGHESHGRAGRCRLVLPLLVLGGHHRRVRMPWPRGKCPGASSIPSSCRFTSYDGGYSLKVTELLYRYGGGIAFLGGWGAIATARHLGFPWAQIFWGQEAMPIWGWIVAFVIGMLLARLDIRVMRWILRSRGLLRESSSTPAEEAGDTWFSLLFEAMKWGGISFGEEGVRVGMIALVGMLLPGEGTFVLSAVLVGILIGLMHILYLNTLFLPTKTLFHVFLSLVFVQWGILVSFVVHFAFNLSMVFDIEIAQ